jgi:cell division protein ZapE
VKPSEKYDDILKQSEFVSDAAQKQSVALLDRLHDSLIHRETRGAPNWWQRLLFFKKPLNPVRGIYFWGGVGRGKTFLMDIFYQCLPIEKKKRAHFHQFMNEIHQALKQTKDIENHLKR